MNKLTNLIEQLCPNGVEFKPLGEIATISRGGSFQKKDFVDSGVPCIHYGQIYTRYGLFAYETLSFISNDVAKKQRYAQPNDIVMAVTSENIEDVCKCVAWLGDTSVAVSGHSAIIHHTQNAKYLAYYFHSSMFFSQKRKLAQGTKVIEVSPEKLNRVSIPVPPLEVQAEIVRILDTFTELTTELITELITELTNRKKQYEYYRGKLLCFESNIPKKKLGETCILKAGNSISSFEISEIKNDISSVPCYGGNGIRGYVKTANKHGNYPLIGRQGALCGNVQYAKGDFYATEHAVVVNSEKAYIPRFLFHLLIHMNLNQYKSAGAQPGLSVKNLQEISAPVPPIKEQQRIVSILDRFDKLCNDISEGLPAEIDARQKQYEYYRDKLLTFKERRV